MSPAVLLLLLRAVSALLLLAFFVVLVVMLLRDIEYSTEGATGDEQARGFVVVTRVDGTTQRFPLLPVTTIGRSRSSTVLLDTAYTSSRHALITLRGANWWIEDLGSRNGTLLNDFMLEQSAIVTPADTVTVGDAQIRIELAG